MTAATLSQYLERIDLRHDRFVVERRRIVAARGAGTAPFSGVCQLLGLGFDLFSEIDARDGEHNVAARLYDAG